jgi:rhodanese-related sulfurtransferase
MVVGYLVASGFLFRHYVVRVHKACALLTRGAILVDVDTAEEFARHHPRVAVNIPLEQLARRVHELGGLERPIVVFAHSWARGARAVHRHGMRGFTEVLNAAGLYTRERLSVAGLRTAEAQAPKDLAELSPGSMNER